MLLKPLTEVMSNKVCLQVMDDGMSLDGIASGDRMIVDCEVEIQNNDVVAIWIDSKFIARRISYIGTKCFATPSNPDMDKQILEGSVIMGKVIERVLLS